MLLYFYKLILAVLHTAIFLFLFIFQLLIIIVILDNKTVFIQKNKQVN